MTRSLAAAVAMAMAAPAGAQGVDTAFDDDPANTDRGWELDAATLARMCSPRGSFQFAFGQTGVPGSSPLERKLAGGFALPEDAAPFTKAQPSSTRWSDQFFAIDFGFESEAVADDMQALSEEIDRLLLADGWLERPEDYDPPLYKYAYAGDPSWYRVEGTGDDPPEIMLALSEFGDTVTLSCARSDLALLAMEEELGHLPKGTPRPAEPVIPIVPVPTVADCARPETAAEIDAFLADGSPDSFTRSLFARADYQERLSQWMMWRLEEAGASDEEVLELAMDAAMLSGGPEGVEASLEAFLDLLPLVAALDEAQKAGDRDGVCQAFVGVTGIYGRMAANATAQTHALEASYRREAPKYGIDPEE